MMLGHDGDDTAFAACVVYSSHDDYAMNCVLQGIRLLARHVDARDPGLPVFALPHDPGKPLADPFAEFCRGMDKSRKLVILASPQSAMSPHVDAEIREWLTNRSPDDIIIVLVSGTLVLDDEAGRFDMEKSSAISSTLNASLTKPPVVLDMAGIPTKEGERVPASHYDGLVRRLAAAIQDCPASEIIVDPPRSEQPWGFLTS
jgi:hypothetical protein